MRTIVDLTADDSDQQVSLIEPLTFERWPRWMKPLSGDTSVSSVLIDTGSRELRRMAWLRAADRLANRPPACPRLEPGSADSSLLERFWPDWLRIMTNLAINQFVFMEAEAGRSSSGPTPSSTPANPTIDLEVLAGMIVGGLMGTMALGEIAKYWHDMYPEDSKAISRRLIGGSLPMSSPSFDAALGGVVDDPTFIRAISRALIWQKGLSVDARPGLLESRWVAWPPSGLTGILIHLSHRFSEHVYTDYDTSTTSDTIAPKPMAVPILVH